MSAPPSSEGLKALNDQILVTENEERELSLRMLEYRDRIDVLTSKRDGARRRVQELRNALEILSKTEEP